MSKMIGSKRRVRSNHASYHFVFTKAACTDLHRNFSSNKMPLTCSIVDRPKKRLFGPGDESAVLIIVLHTSSVLVTVRASEKKAKINSGREIIVAISRNSGVFCRILVVFTEIENRNKKPRSGNHFDPHGKIFQHLIIFS